jgi:plastocyanin
MTRRAARIALVTAAAALALAGCGGDDEETASTDGGSTTAAATDGGGGSTLEGSVGPGFDISLEGTDGIEAGDYTITVDDQSPSHNFHLTGPGGVDVSTSVGDEGEESFEVTLEPGEYTFLCDPHASQMRGTFTVG